MDICGRLILMKYIDKYSNLGDSLSSILFNFACSDIRTSNLRYWSDTKYSKIRIGSLWTEGFLETLSMSSNWESVKQQVHNASAYWNDNLTTIVYKNIFPMGQVSKSTILAWLNSNFPTGDYSEGHRINVVYFEWYKNPALHNPPKKSRQRFGKLTDRNNVHIKTIYNTIYVVKNSRWTELEDGLHITKPCLYENPCGECWGRAYYPSYTSCIPQPTYYLLSCLGPEEIEEIEDPCDKIPEIDIEWEFPTTESSLNNNTLYQKISSTNLKPYSIGFKTSYNPYIEEVTPNVYTYYINNSLIPVLETEYVVDRKFAFNIEYTYSYFPNTNSFELSSTLSSSDFNFEEEINFPIKISHSDLTTIIKAYGLKKLINNLDAPCNIGIRVTTSWYRWVTNNLNLSSTPYWHIGIEPGFSLGFDHSPVNGIPDPSNHWEIAHDELENSLSAYFGTFDDMMGKVINIEIYQ